MKLHVGVDAASGPVNTFVGTASNVADVTLAHALLHGEKTIVLAGVGCLGVEKRVLH